MLRSPLQPPFARNASEAMYQRIWPTIFGWSAALGITGNIARDCSGNALHGTLTNMVPAEDWVRAERGLALDFDGSTSDHIVLPNTDLFRFGTGDFTLMAWVKSDTTSGYKIFLGKDGSARDWVIGFGATVSGKWQFVGFPSSIVSLTSNASVDTGLHLVGVRRKQGTLTIYVDGVANGSTTYTTSLTGSNAVHIGQRETSPQSWDGLIYDVLGYKQALAEADIAMLYRLGPGGWARLKGLENWYLPEDSSGSAVVDHAGIVMRHIFAGAL